MPPTVRPLTSPTIRLFWAQDLEQLASGLFHNTPHFGPRRHFAGPAERGRSPQRPRSGVGRPPRPFRWRLPDTAPSRGSSESFLTGFPSHPRRVPTPRPGGPATQPGRRGPCPSTNGRITQSLTARTLNIPPLADDPTAAPPRPVAVNLRGRRTATRPLETTLPFGGRSLTHPSSDRVPPTTRASQGSKSKS